MGESSRDVLFAKEIIETGEFEFDDKVAGVFEDMIKRSVPGYGMTLSLLPLIAQRYAQADSRVYDLGCSLGAGMMAMNAGLDSSVSFVGVDNSKPMLERCQRNLAQSMENSQYTLLHQDILDTSIENASIVVLNFTLQFIPKEKRLPLLSRIQEGLLPGGILLLSEKIEFEEASIQERMTKLHHDFKRSQGYSQLEISQKRNALENVLIPESISAHKQRLDEAGFTVSETWLQCFNFVSMVAFKD